jgi:hypothetical protein
MQAIQCEYLHVACKTIIIITLCLCIKLMKLKLILCSNVKRVTRTLASNLISLCDLMNYRDKYIVLNYLYLVIKHSLL